MCVSPRFYPTWIRRRASSKRNEEKKHEREEDEEVEGSRGERLFVCFLLFYAVYMLSVGIEVRRSQFSIILAKLADVCIHLCKLYVKIFTHK